MTSPEKLALLRAKMADAGIDAYIIPNTDPHQSEYIAAHWQALTWLSGFNGSAANVVVTQSFAGLWTDSRYFLQAEAQLAGSGIELMRLKVPHTPEYVSWITSEMPQNSRVGLDGRLFSVSKFREMEAAFSTQNIHLTDAGDLPGSLWVDKPAMPADPIYLHDLHFAGRSHSQKMLDIRKRMHEEQVEYQLITSLDDIAWLYNIRGSDVSCNPVAYSYALITPMDSMLFIEGKKVPAEVATELAIQGVRIAPYEALGSFLEEIPAGKRLYLDPQRSSQSFLQHIPLRVRVIEGIQYTTPLKARKNPVEVNHIRHAMQREGVAWVRMLMWIEAQVGHRTLTECDIADQLEQFRAPLDYYKGPSFESIIGYAANGAIVHYRPERGRDSFIHPENLLLIDAGGQYLDGTTDMTRTLALGTPTAEQKRDFTLVLKGHIQVAMIVFPQGTRAHQLDTLARQFLWAHQMNYGHGTGHGVGFFLSVHEGPQSIGPSASGNAATILEPGMLTSNEPGVYHPGQYGIRVENLVVCVEQGEREGFGKFLAFETVSLCPIDLQLVDVGLLTAPEIAWLDSYHQRVYEGLSPLLEEPERVWLRGKTVGLARWPSA